MDELLKKIFKDDEKLDVATITDRLNKEGVKLADLSKGGYVDKKKYEDEINALNKKYSDLDEEYKQFVEEITDTDDKETKEYNEFMKQFEDLKKTSQATAQELDLYKKKDIMRNNGINTQRFMDLALFELKDSQNFEDDIKKWAEDNKNLIAPPDDDKNKGNTNFRTAPRMSGNPDADIDTNDDFTRGMLKGAGLKEEDLKK